MPAIPILCLLLCLVLPGHPLAASLEFEVPLESGEDIPVTRYPAEGNTRLIWLPSEFGISPRQQPTAAALAQLGIDTWIPDLHSGFFLPPGRYSLNDIPPTVIASLIGQAAADGHRVYLLAAGRSNALALRGLRHYQQQHADSGNIGGLISIGPRLFLRTPQGGQAEQFLPIASASNVPVFILQPREAGGFWRVARVAEVLQSGGAPVYLRVLPGVSDGFNTREDHSEQEKIVTAQLPGLLRQAIHLLDFKGGLPAQPAPLAGEDLAPEADRSGDLLKPYPGNQPTPSLRLPDLDGRQHDLESLAGKVVLVNFWATWCPPCVEELPSLQRLYQGRREQGLEILAVDVGETATQVRTFLKSIETRVDFPVLIDADGAELKRWGIHAFPTTLVLDRSQRIRLAGFGAFAWDAPEVLQTLDRLLQEP